MSTLDIPLEISGRVLHPEFLRLEHPFGVSPLRLLDTPILKPLHDGAPDLGWAGDPRFAVYMDEELCKPVFVRLEADGEYRIMAHAPAYTIINNEWVNKLIRRLVALDTRRAGNDPAARVDAHNAKVAAEHRRQYEDRVENDLADRLKWALKKDHADDYC